jgi:hypothetical protein
MKLLLMPTGGVARRTLIKRFAAKKGLGPLDASRMRTRDIVMWLRQNVRYQVTDKAKTGT